MLYIFHRQYMLNDNVFIRSLTVDQFDSKFFGLEFVCMYPGSHNDALTETKLTFALPFYIQMQFRPGLFYFILPGSQGACLSVIVLLDFHTLLNLWHIKTSGVFFYHASHAEGWRAGSNSLLHKSNPGMRYTIRASIVVSWNYLLLDQ